MQRIVVESDLGVKSMWPPSYMELQALQAIHNRHRDIYSEALLYRPIDKRDVLRFRSKIMRACCIRRQHLVLCEDGSLWRVMLGANGALRKHRQAWTARIQWAFEGGV